jgi:acetyl esterase/lipase
MVAATIGISPANGTPVKRGLVYGQIGKLKLRLDLYYPKSPPPRNGYPLIICIHGGGWMIGNRGKDFFLRNLTKDGVALARIDYRLSGTAKYPAQIDDARNALAWLLKSAPVLQLDANRIGVFGVSAGGHLALLLGLSQPESSRSIKAICALYPPTDLIGIVPPEKRDRRHNAVAALLGAPVSERLALARAASPMTYVSREAPPVLLIHGDRDHLVPIEQSRMLEVALRKAGAESTLIICPGRGHGFSLRREILAEVADFFARNLGVCLKNRG